MQTHGRGYSLIELLTIISILAMLLMAASPLLKNVDENRQVSQIFEMLRLIETARSAAIGTGRIITLCGSSDGISCTKNWKSATVLIFDDQDNNHQLGSREKTLYRAQMPNGEWHWHGSNKPYLRFRSDGTSIEWGHFTLCPIGKKNNYASQITLNFVGRPYAKRLSKQELEANDLCN